MKKKLLIAVGIVIVLAIVAGVVVFSNLDKIVRAATEQVMRYVLQVDVTVGSAHVSVTEGSIEFRDINIPNPEGYSTNRAMKFGLVRAQVDIRSFSTDEPIINEIRVSQAEITMEVRKGGSNLQDLIDNASRLAAGEGTPEEEAEKPEEAQKQFKIEKVLVDGNVVRVAIPFMGGKTVDIKLPDLELRDLGGKGGEGVTAPEAMQEFLAAILMSIKDQGVDVLPDEVLADLGNTLKELPGNVQEQLGDVGTQLEESVKDVSGQIGEEADKAADQVKEGLKGLFGGKKETPVEEPK